ncbi:hypothetical protein [Metabacillus idriensis]|uniref:hypothetical protein n=1 Tax=Metabacillus idriensis TaxID=324768 RepID=UPI003D2DFCD8
MFVLLAGTREILAGLEGILSFFQIPPRWSALCYFKCGFCDDSVLLSKTEILLAGMFLLLAGIGEILAGLEGILSFFQIPPRWSALCYFKCGFCDDSVLLSKTGFLLAGMPLLLAGIGEILAGLEGILSFYQIPPRWNALICYSNADPAMNLFYFPKQGFYLPECLFY